MVGGYCITRCHKNQLRCANKKAIWWTGADLTRGAYNQTSRQWCWPLQTQVLYPVIIIYWPVHSFLNKSHYKGTHHAVSQASPIYFWALQTNSASRAGLETIIYATGKTNSFQHIQLMGSWAWCWTRYYIKLTEFVPSHTLCTVDACLNAGGRICA